MSRALPRVWNRKIKAAWRDTVLLLRQFRTPLLLFVLVQVGFGWLYEVLSRFAGAPMDGPAASIYLILTLIFLQSSQPFPHPWYLQVFYFILPVIGLGILAQGLADFAVLFFNRRARSKEWEMAVASTYKDHVVLIGLGHLGYRVVHQLLLLDQEVVVIESNPKLELLTSIRALGVPVIEDDGTRDVVLDHAGVRRARSVILCTQNDSLNLQMALKSRSMNPHIQVIIRIFDDDFAQSLHAQFGFIAFSATSMAAPIFAASAAGVEITPPISIAGVPNSLARLDVRPRAAFLLKTVAEIERTYDLSLVLLRHAGNTDLHPSAEKIVSAGDMIAVLGSPPQINHLVQDNRK
jgi:Trk K+ transport system NAD-binding subunit